MLACARRGLRNGPATRPAAASARDPPDAGSDVTIRLLNSLHQLGANASLPPPAGLIDLIDCWTSRAADRPAALAELAQNRLLRHPELQFVGGSILDLEFEHAGPMHVLDVGCGALPLAEWLSGRGHVGAALDLNVGDLRSLRRRPAAGQAAARARYLVGRAEQLPFPDARFSLVTLVGVLHDLQPGSDQVALWEAARVLRPGGHLILTVEMAPPGDSAPRHPASGRRGADPFPPQAAERLLDTARELFEVPRRILPEEIKTLSWDELDASIQEAFAGTEPRGRPRRSVTLAAVLRRRSTRLAVSPALMLSTVLAEQERRMDDFAGWRVDGAGDGVGADQTSHPSGRDLSKEALMARIEVLEAERRRFEQMAEARFRVIRRQEQTLDAYRRRHWRAPLNWVLTPKIGTFFHYEPIPLQVPPRYSDRPAVADPPRISIVTPSLNQGQFIARTIRSVIEQGYPMLEYFVQDGGSTDATLDVLERFRDRLSGLASEPDRGFGDAINRGFARSTGEVMAYLNSDDILLPGALHQVAHVFRTRPEVDVVYGHRVIINEHDREVGRWVLPPHDDDILTWVDYIPQETLFWRRSIWEKAGGRIDDSFKFAIDWDLLLRFRDAGAKFERLPRFLGAFRVHPLQKTSSELDEVGVQEMAQLRQRCHGRPVSLAEILRKHVLLHKLYRLGLLNY
jgi:SAM-dependent methyltransferase